MRTTLETAMLSDPSSATGLSVRLGDLTLDLQARELRGPQGRPVELRRKALDVLLLLAQRAGHVVDKDALLAHAWPGVVVGGDSLVQTIVEIRRVLGDQGRPCPLTVARRGYRLQPTAGSAGGAALPPLSVAVLAIAHDGAGPDGARLAAALMAELTARAGVGLSDSKVVARETVAAAGAALSDPRVAARQLGVRQLVCGELRAVAEGWSVLLSIVDGASGERRWSHRFVLDSQAPQIDEVVARAGRALLVEMHRCAAAIAAARPLEERSADDLAMQGWACLYDGISPENVEQAQRHFEQAVRKDASHARSLTGVSCSTHLRELMGWAPDRAEAQRQVIEVARRLERLYPQDRLTALASASAADIEGRWDLRLSIGDRLCERDPADPSAHAVRASALLQLARFDDCVAAIDKALSLSIDDFRAGWWHAIAANAHLMSGRYEAAVSAARQSIAANACLPLPPVLLAAALAGTGRPAEGRDTLRRLRLREPKCNREWVAMLLGGGNELYERGCARVLHALDALGIEED